MLSNYSKSPQIHGGGKEGETAINSRLTITGIFLSLFSRSTGPQFARFGVWTLWHCFSVRAASGSQCHCLCSLSPSQVAAEPSSMPLWPCNLTLSAYISTKLYLPLCACRNHRISRQAWNTAWAADAHAVGTSGLASQSWDYGSDSKHWACKIDTDHNRDAALDLVLQYLVILLI